MIAREYYDKQAVLKGINLELSVTEAKQVRAALSEFDAVELGSYGGILEILRRTIPQQYGR